jgi:hypothetical protein
MLVACRLAGLSAIEAHYAELLPPKQTPTATTRASELTQSAIALRSAGFPRFLVAFLITGDGAA